MVQWWQNAKSFNVLTDTDMSCFSGERERLRGRALVILVREMSRVSRTKIYTQRCEWKRFVLPATVAIDGPALRMRARETTYAIMFNTDTIQNSVLADPARYIYRCMLFPQELHGIGWCWCSNEITTLVSSSYVSFHKKITCSWCTLACILVHNIQYRKRSILSLSCASEIHSCIIIIYI